MVLQQPTVEAYEKYIATHPQGNHLLEAKELAKAAQAIEVNAHFNRVSSEAHISETEPASDTASFSGWRAYLFVGLPLGLITGVTVGFIGSWVGEWFNEWLLVFRVPAQVICSAVIATIAGCVAGLSVNVIVRPLTARFSTLEADKQIGFAGGVGIILGLLGGPICVFIGGTPALITGAMLGACVGTLVAITGEKK